MSSPCLICLDPVKGEATHHPACIQKLFGRPNLPEIDVDLAKLHTLGLAMVGHTSISGIQRKISVGLAADGRRLQLATDGGRYLLKPQSQTFPSLPENEHATMQIARRLGIEIPECGLVRLRDGSLAYIVKRFDRSGEGRKFLQEDFCQLAEQSPKQKYEGSAELCGRLVLQYATEPLVESLKLFRLMVFIWWSGNGDAHLKNFSLLRDSNGVYRLSPAYDLLCTRLVLPADQLALSVVGNKKNVTRRQWLKYARSCELPERAATRVLDDLVAKEEVAQELLGRSWLPDEMKGSYRDLIQRRTSLLSVGKGRRS